MEVRHDIDSARPVIVPRETDEVLCRAFLLNILPEGEFCMFQDSLWQQRFPGLSADEHVYFQTMQ